jgi:[acyl-carrier-protein] S-malonyltransferase
MAEGPEDELVLTENAQPALMAVSLATLRVLENQGGFDVASACTLVAGHSLGEYSALAAARSLPLDVAARLLKTRGRAMQQAVPVGEGAMCALIGVGPDVASAIAAEAAGGEVCTVANDNAPGQVVLSGAAAAIERVAAIAPEHGARRTIKLPVSAPFHCDLMAPAAEVMAKALADITIAVPVVPVVANVIAEPVDDPGRIGELLVAQVTGMVRWRGCVLAMKAHGVDTLVEIGAGAVLTGLARRIDKELTAVSVSDPAGVDSFLESF